MSGPYIAQTAQHCACSSDDCRVNGCAIVRRQHPLAASPAPAAASGGGIDWASVFSRHLGSSSLHSVVSEFIAATPSPDIDRITRERDMAVEALSEIVSHTYVGKGGQPVMRSRYCNYDAILYYRAASALKTIRGE